MNEIIQSIFEPIGLVLFIITSMVVIDLIYYIIIQLYNHYNGKPIQSYKEFNNEIIKLFEENDTEI